AEFAGSIDGGVGNNTLSMGDAVLDAGASISGFSSIVTDDLVNDGTITAGTGSPSVLVRGDFTQGPSGTLILPLAGAASFGRVAVTGAANLGGTLTVQAA